MNRTLISPSARFRLWSFFLISLTDWYRSSPTAPVPDRLSLHSLALCVSVSDLPLPNKDQKCVGPAGSAVHV